MQSNLFDDFSPVRLPVRGGDVTYHPAFMCSSEAQESFSALKDSIAWEQPWIWIMGVHRPIPRLTAWYGDEGCHYGYSGLNLKINAWCPDLYRIKLAVERFINSLPEMAGEKIEFNSVLLNYYRDGKDSVSWHSDDEKELGVNPVIASISLGGERDFGLRPSPVYEDKDPLACPTSVRLGSGSLLIMKGETQKNWLHQISKCSVASPRINLTFRRIIINN